MSYQTVEDFLLRAPPYEIIKIQDDAESQRILTLLMFGHMKLDSHCIECGRDSVFERHDDVLAWASHQDASFLKAKSSVTRDHVFLLRFGCVRLISHELCFLINYRNFELCKAGQFPSLADLHLPELAKYKKVLGDRQKELVKGVGLASHGVGIGSFAYLRRIFEHLIEEAAGEERQRAGWNEDAYFQQRMDEKIQTLRSHLPTFLVENRSLYGILSKGIHSLEESECLDCFPTVLAGIEMILDQRLHAFEQAEKAKKASNAIAVLKASHGNKP